MVPRRAGDDLAARASRPRECAQESSPVLAHYPGAPPPSVATRARTTDSQRGWCDPRTVRRAAARGVPAAVRAWLGLTWLGLGFELGLGLGLGFG